MKKAVLSWMVLVIALAFSGCGKAGVETEAPEKEAEAVQEEEEEEEKEEEQAEKEEPEEEKDAEEQEESANLDEMISEAILAQEGEHYASGECAGEGHIVLDSEEETLDEKVTLTVYALTMYGEYQFQDGNFVKESGTGVIPAVMTFTVEDGNYGLKNYRLPEDGGRYVDSIQEMFPERLWNDCISPSDKQHGELTRQERTYAEAYLKEIGREAQIGDYRDFEHTLLTDAGVSVEVSNSISENKDLGAYPFWLGNVERLEGKIRYRYSMELDQEKNRIVFQKYDMDNEKVEETVSFDAGTGEPVKNVDESAG